MTDRRKFVKHLTMSLAGSIIGTHIASSEPRDDLNFNDPGFWERVRGEFPLSTEKVYFNTGTFGPPSTRVLKVMREKMDYFSSTGEYGSTTAAREKLSQFLHVKTEEISLTHNTTEGINIIAWGLPLKRKDEVIITNQEHVGNALPWLNRAKLHGIVLKPFQPGKTREENINLIQKLITPRTKVIAIPHITCTSGVVMPVKEISALAKDKGIFTAIDGAQSVGCIDLSLKELNCDFYAGCCHKWMLGPAGTGFLYVKENLLDQLQPYWVGAHSDVGWSLDLNSANIIGYAPSAHRFDFGTQNSALYAGVREAAMFLEEIGMHRVEARVRELGSYLFTLLSALEEKLVLVTPSEELSRLGMISFRPKRMDYLEFNKIALQNTFRVRAVPESNQNCIRVSTHIYNSKEEIERFVELIKKNL